MSDWRLYLAILAVGAAAYAMRAGGYLVMGVLPQTGLLPRLLRLAPGNLFVGFSVAGILEGGWPSLAGCAAAVVAMAATKKEWAALAAGFTAAAVTAALL
ncbi:MAG TPA: AzlD domain-containing protein [Aliidongia sp.]|uniref:AzlD domain-containing protein n=1 Tax=Aliidongia sp. TaxID=1914230 RepID=UPI002DDD364D|nr:AzlD domain-containing protein [Aliidongia sp.]HEV2674268.1 AzlD domain-containing protein [Aliidongia sp.]